MTEINEFTGILTRITAGGTGQQALDKLNLPLSQIEAALNTLAGRISGMASKCAVVKKDAPLSSDCYPGALVYFNTEPEHMRYEPALAQLLGEFGTQGQSVEAPCARVVGIVLDKKNVADGTGNVQGTLLLGGYWESPVFASGTIDGTPTAGIYYLSPDTPGKATLDPQYHLRQPIFCYEGEGKLVMGLQYMAHDNHFHGSLTLDGANWTAAADRPAGVSLPAGGARWIYVDDDTQGYINLGELSSRTTAVFHEGLLQNEDHFVVSGGYVWCKDQDAPEDGSVVIFNSYPFSYDSPVVRDIESGNDALTIKFQNGRVLVTQNDFEQGEIEQVPMAIYGIDGKTLKMTQVLTGLRAGPGTTVSVNQDGVATIASSLMANTPLDAYSINHNGTTVTSDGTFLYLTFPAGRTSTMVINMNVNGMQSDMELDAKVWGCCAGQGATFNVNVYWLPAPVADGPVDIPSTPTALGTLTFPDAGTGKLSYGETSTALRITGNGQLVASVAISAQPSNDIRLTRIGFIYSLV